MTCAGVQSKCESQNQQPQQTQMFSQMAWDVLEKPILEDPITVKDV